MVSFKNESIGTYRMRRRETVIEFLFLERKTNKWILAEIHNAWGFHISLLSRKHLLILGPALKPGVKDFFTSEIILIKVFSMRLTNFSIE